MNGTAGAHNNNDNGRLLKKEDDLFKRQQHKLKHHRGNCNSCEEAQMEIQISLKVIQDLTTRISELQQTMSYCQHQPLPQSQSAADDDGNVNNKSSSTTNALTTTNVSSSSSSTSNPRQESSTKINATSSSSSWLTSTIIKPEPDVPPPTSTVQTPQGCLEDSLKLELIPSSSLSRIYDNVEYAVDHHNHKGFACSVCQRQFKEFSGLVSHQKAKKHGSYYSKKNQLKKERKVVGVGVPMSCLSGRRQMDTMMPVPETKEWMGYMSMCPGPFQVPPPKSQTPSEMQRLHKDPHSLWTPSWKRKEKGGDEVDDLKDEEEEEEEVFIDPEIIIHKAKEILETEQLTPANFDKVVNKFMCLGLGWENKDEWTIPQVIYLIYEKGLSEPSSFPTFCANLIKTLCDKSHPDTAKKLRKQMLDQCQFEFQSRSNTNKEEQEIQKLEENLGDTQDLIKLEIQEKRSMLRKRAIGNIRFVGELYKLHMLTPRIMIDNIINMLLATQDEDNLECLCELLKIVGPKLEEQLTEVEIRAQESIKRGITPKFNPDPKYMDKTFDTLNSLSTNAKLSSRIRRALLDVYELRRNGWKPSNDTLNPGSHFDQILPPQKRDGWNCIKSSNKSTRFAAQKKNPTGSDSCKVTLGGPSPPQGCTSWSRQLEMNEEILSNLRHEPEGGGAAGTSEVRSETGSTADDDDDSSPDNSNGLLCSACGISCRTERRKRKHIKNKHGVGCGLCNGNFHAYPEYLRHMNKVHGYNSNQFPCFECGSILTSKTQALKHVIKTHAGLGKDGKQLIWACGGVDGCKAQFLSLMEKESHVRRQHDDDDVVVTTNLLGEVRIEKRNNK